MPAKSHIENMAVHLGNPAIERKEIYRITQAMTIDHSYLQF